MTAPIYFIPNSKLEDLKAREARTLERAWLTSIFNDAPDASTSFFQLKGSGPGGFQGCIAATWGEEAPSRLGYYEQHQEWQPVGDGTRLWIGLDPNEPPTPKDLARPKQLPGYKIDLADGKQWLIPTYRLVNGDYGLPFDFYRAGNEIVREVKPRFADKWEQAGEVWSAFMGEAKFSEEMALDYSTEALGVNYRYDANLHARLRLFDSTNWEDLLGATVDLPRVIEALAAQKKTSSED